MIKIVFACDAGMGSSAMGAAKFRGRIREVCPDVTVVHSAVDRIPEDCDIAVVQSVMEERAAAAAPGAQLITVKNFLTDPALDTLFGQLTAEAGIPSFAAAEPGTGMGGLLTADGIRLGQTASGKEEAIEAAGKLLVSLGYAEESYISAMLQRERMITTYLGNGVAIPHGMAKARDAVKKSGIVFLQYPDGVAFGEETAYLVIGIADAGEEQMEILNNLCGILENEDILQDLIHAENPEVVLKHLKC